jgi:hypothetical protein
MYRAVATRYEKLAIHYLGLVRLGIIRMLLERLDAPTTQWLVWPVIRLTRRLRPIDCHSISWVDISDHDTVCGRQRGRTWQEPMGPAAR